MEPKSTILFAMHLQGDGKYGGKLLKVDALLGDVKGNGILMGETLK